MSGDRVSCRMSGKLSALPADCWRRSGIPSAFGQVQALVRLDRSRRVFVKKNSGFTLLELIVGITIAAILAALTVPSFLQAIRTNRGVGDANGILAVLTFARNEAIKRDATVMLCASSNGSSCSTSATWDKGYLLYVDANGDGSYDSSPAPADVLIRAEAPLSGTSTINLCSGKPTASAGTSLSTISFSGTGQVTSQAYFDVNPTTKTGSACPASTTAKVTGERYVVLRQIGRANVCDPTDTNCGQ